MIPSEKIKIIKLKGIYNKGFLVIFICFQLLPFFLKSGQSQSNNSHALSLIDSTQKIYGSSDLLVNGTVYYQPNRQALGNPFLFSSEFMESTVYTRGVTFEDVEVNYDIVNQKLILLNEIPNGSRLHISLSDILIDSFLLKDYLYINPKKLNLSSYYSYMMLINNDQYYLLIGYKKEFINRFSQSNPYGKFSDKKQTLFLVSNGIQQRINSKKAFLNTFPSARKSISTYLRKHKIKLLKATPEQLKQLMEFYNYQRELTYE